MSADGQTNLLKFINILGTWNKTREFVDQCTQRSRTQTRVPRGEQQHSVSLSPSTKHKRKLTNQEDKSNPKGAKRVSNMDVSDVKDNGKHLLPELLELKEEMKTDMEMLITPLKASIDALLQIKQAWEEGIKECRTLQQINVKLSTQIEKVEDDNKQLQDRV